MSYGIMPFAVRLIRVERAFGSRDAALASEITEKFEHHFENDDCEDDEPTLEDALHEIIEGKRMQEDYGHKYGYVLEVLCWHFGKFLPNAHFSAMRLAWADRVDQGLSQAGVPEETLGLKRYLMFRGSPIPIPRSPEPAIGYLKAAEVGPALRAIKAADLAVLDPEVQDAVRELRGWLEACSTAVCDLVCFYH